MRSSISFACSVMARDPEPPIIDGLLFGPSLEFALLPRPKSQEDVSVRHYTLT